jgi:hypothetical protein
MSDLRTPLRRQLGRWPWLQALDRPDAAAPRAEHCRANRAIDRIAGRFELRRLLASRRMLSGLLGLLLSASLSAPLSAAPLVRFAVVGNVPAGTAGESAARTLLSALGAAQPGFILDTGNLKLAGEQCSDTLLQSRVDLLNTSPLPLILIPGANDWVNCQLPEAGGYDPLERLDFLREHFLDNAESLGQKTLPLTRESDVTRFRQFHENIEWQDGPVLFIGLNVSSSANHFMRGGGRNGEFEDRVVANRYWLEHAYRVSQRRRTEAVVIAIEGDPGWEEPRRRGAFDWFNFGEAQPRDPYLEFKRDLLKFAQQFGGPVLLVHQADFKVRAEGAARETPPKLGPAFRLELPERRKKGAPVTHIWQLQIDAQPDARRWVAVEVVTGHEPVFRVATHQVPADMVNAPLDSGSQSAAPHYPLPDSASGVTAPDLLPLPAETVPNLLEQDEGGNDAKAHSSQPQ